MRAPHRCACAPSQAKQNSKLTEDAAYERTFGEYNEKKKTYGFTVDHLAYLNAFPLVAYAIGVIIFSQIGERFGRKAVFYSMNCICIIGVAICYAGRTYAWALAGRMIINLHVGAEAWLVPMWLAEIVPAAVRGSSKSNAVETPAYYQLSRPHLHLPTHCTYVPP